MQVDNLMLVDGSTTYYDPAFRYTLESHLAYFRAAQDTNAIQVNPNDTIIYDQDFFGFLLSRNIKNCFHWFIMRLNNMFSPYEFGSGFTSILVPNTADLESIRQSFIASTTISS